MKKNLQIISTGLFYLIFFLHATRFVQQNDGYKILSVIDKHTFRSMIKYISEGTIYRNAESSNIKLFCLKWYFINSKIIKTEKIFKKTKKMKKMFQNVILKLKTQVIFQKKKKHIITVKIEKNHRFAMLFS